MPSSNYSSSAAVHLWYTTARCSYSIYCRVGVGSGYRGVRAVGVRRDRLVFLNNTNRPRQGNGVLSGPEKLWSDNDIHCSGQVGRISPSLIYCVMASMSWRAFSSSSFDSFNWASSSATWESLASRSALSVCRSCFKLISRC